MRRRRLPIGIQTFRELRERDCYYVDKTEYIARLADEGKHYFLSRPRRFGKARANRDFLRGLYAVVKDCEAHVRFTFLTGVSKFSKVSLFSGLNNLTDITLDPRYSTICGYTDVDLDTVFAPEIPGLDRNEIREWYNGYSWRGTERVYNPYDILLLFDRREFDAWWFETGTPSFLVDTLTRRGVGAVTLESMVASGDLLSAVPGARRWTQCVPTGRFARGLSRQSDPDRPGEIPTNIKWRARSRRRWPSTNVVRISRTTSEPDVTIPRLSRAPVM